MPSLFSATKPLAKSTPLRQPKESSSYCARPDPGHPGYPGPGMAPEAPSHSSRSFFHIPPFPYLRRVQNHTATIHLSMTRILPFFLILQGLFLSLLPAQVDLVGERFAFEPDLTYDPDLPSPEAYLGYSLGERFTVYARAVAYFEALAAASDRVVLNRYGETYEGRPLINVILTSAANQGQLEELRQRHLRLTAPAGLSDGEARQLLDEAPVFISMSYNIHGNEASSTEAAMQVAYRLAAAQDAGTQAVLDNSVINLFVCINPDGRDRYVYWYNGMARQVVGKEPRDLEHYAPWPNGRTNHYWFDLNRDWVWGDRKSVV